MIRHSASHGCATLACTVTAGMLVGLLHRYLPRFLGFLDPVVAPVVALLGGLPFFTLENTKVVLLAAVFALVWGVFFKLASR